jgi:GT2 family glycosyltransferase
MTLTRIRRNDIDSNAMLYKNLKTPTHFKELKRQIYGYSKKITKFEYENNYRYNMRADIAAVIVTYNRLEYLKKVVLGVLQQNIKISEIIIVNNGSTDETSEWLAEQHGITVIEQDNVGGAGGFYTGMKYAYEKGYEWIWIMDDDVLPEKDCLQNLLDGFDENTIRNTLRFSLSGSPYVNDTISYNFNNPFKSMWKEIVSDSYFNNDHYECDGPTFEGALFNRKVINKIGFPRKELFIFADDTEYFVRAKRAGFRIIVRTKAKMTRLIDPTETAASFTWKHYYMIRNTMVLDMIYGNLPVRLLRPLAYLAKWLIRSKKVEDIKVVLKAYKDSLKFTE